MNTPKFLVSILFMLMPISNSAQGAVSDSCVDLFTDWDGIKRPSIQNGRPNILDSLTADPSLQLQIAQAAENIPPETSVLTTQKMKAFAQKYLPFFKNPDQREALVQVFEAEMRLRSLETVQSLKSNKENFYDLILTGAGPQSVVFLTKFLELNPNARVLVIDRADTAGSTFRYLGDALTINSSNRESGKDKPPVPGKGNINELAGLPIQVSDMTGVKYPTGNDLSSAIIAGFYANFRNNPRVDLAFRTEVSEALTEASPNHPVYTTGAVLKFEDGQQTIVRSLIAVTGPGLGMDRVPENVLRAISKNTNFVKPLAGQKIAPVISVADLLRDINLGKNLLDALKDKTLIIAGDGDYAYVLIESLLGYMVKSGYGVSTAQTIGPARIIWLNQSAKSCNEFIAKIRSRYAAIGTGFRNSAGLEALIKPIAAKLSSIDGTPEKLSAVLADGQKVEGDHLILAAGLVGTVRTLFSEGKNFRTDEDFYQRSWDFISERTSISDGKLTKVGLVFKNNPNHFLLGPAVRLPTPEDLVRIVQNYVSLFNNVPRSVALAISVSENFQNLKKTIPQRDLRRTIVARGFEVETENKGSVLITNLSEKRAVGSLSKNVLISIFKAATFRIRLSSRTQINQNQIDFVVGLTPDKKSLILDSEAEIDLTRVAQILATTRDFFNLCREFLIANPQQKLIFSVPIGRQSLIADETQLTFSTESRLRRPSVIVDNAKLSNSLLKQAEYVSLLEPDVQTAAVERDRVNAAPVAPVRPSKEYRVIPIAFRAPSAPVFQPTANRPFSFGSTLGDNRPGTRPLILNLYFSGTNNIEITQFFKAINATSFGRELDLKDARYAYVIDESTMDVFDPSGKSRLINLKEPRLLELIKSLDTGFTPTSKDRVDEVTLGPYSVSLTGKSNGVTVMLGGKIYVEFEGTPSEFRLSSDGRSLYFKNANFQNTIKIVTLDFLNSVPRQNRGTRYAEPL